jgi:hypothetical protein
MLQLQCFFYISIFQEIGNCFELVLHLIAIGQDI